MERLTRLLVLAGLVFVPAVASAYTVVGGGEIVRMDIAIAWENGTQVLAFSPVVRGGGFFVTALPADAQLSEAPPDAALMSLEIERAVDPRRAAQTKPSRPAIVGENTVAAPAPATASATYVDVVVRARLAEVLGEHPPPEGSPGERLHLVAALLTSDVAVRLTPIAVTSRSERVELPLLLARSAKPHPLSLRVLSPRPVSDLGGMEFAFGLQRAGDQNAPTSAATWAARALGSERGEWSFTLLGVPQLNGTARPVAATDFSLPPPQVVPEPIAESGLPPPAEKSSSCGGCQSGRTAGSLALLLALTAIARRKGRRV